MQGESAENSSVDIGTSAQLATSPFAELRVGWMVAWVAIGPLGIRIVTRMSYESASIVFYTVAIAWIYKRWGIFRKHSWNPLAIGDGTTSALGAIAGLFFALAVTPIPLIVLLRNRAAVPLHNIPAVQGSANQWTIAWVILVIVAPITEELLFRAIFLNRWRFTLGRRPGLWVAAILFGAVHGTLFFQMLAFALLLSHLYLRSGDLWPSIAAHSANNAIVMVWRQWGWSAAVRLFESTSTFRSVTWCLICVTLGVAGLVATLRRLGSAAPHHTLLMAETAG